MTSKRLRKLRRVYAPRASRQRLRLTDKRIRRLERERIGSGKSFEAVYRTYQKRRIDHSAAAIAKRYGLSFKEAKELRKKAVKQRVAVKKILPTPEPKPEPQPGQMEFTGNWVDFRRTCKELEKAQSKGGNVSPDFVLAARFGKKEYEGNLANFPHVSWREQGNELFGPAEKYPYWTMIPGLVEGFTYYEKREGVNVLTRFEVVVATDLSNLEKFQ